MSGTPTISEAYTVWGNPYPEDRGRRLDLRVALVVLTRGPWMFRPQILREFLELGFGEVLWTETATPRYDALGLVQAHPGLRFLLAPHARTPGVLINHAAREIRSDRFLVVWDDQTIPESGFQAKIRRLEQDPGVLALVPELRDRRGRPLPSVMVPSLDRDRLKILSLGTDEENVDTLFPPDYSALYDRRRFLQTGGYDPEMVAPFWQKADWGFRGRLWGETLVVVPWFNLDYRGEPPVEDQTPDRSYPRFFLRNLAVRHLGDQGTLPFTRFWSHAHRSGTPWAQALTDFLVQRRWVHRHRYRFQTDARRVTELWGSP